MNQPVKRKRIPYGMMNFIDVREDDCYYVDKTHYIPLIENANKYFFYIRPRRFGKSLTISMLHHYYNILEADKFEKWLCAYSKKSLWCGARRDGWSRPLPLGAPRPMIFK